MTEPSNSWLIGLQGNSPERGSILQDVARLTVLIDIWRSVARMSGRRMGRPVRTGLSPQADVVWAALTDWPSSLSERRTHDKAMRRAVEATAILEPD
jgi:hypothetical protein